MRQGQGKTWTGTALEWMDAEAEKVCIQLTPESTRKKSKGSRKIQKKLYA